MLVIKLIPLATSVNAASSELGLHFKKSSTILTKLKSLKRFTHTYISLVNFFNS